MEQSNLEFSHPETSDSGRKVRVCMNLPWYVQRQGRKLIPGESTSYFKCEHDSRPRVTHSHLFIGLVQLRMRTGWTDYLLTYWMCIHCKRRIWSNRDGFHDFLGAKHRTLAAFRQVYPKVGLTNANTRT